MSQHRHPRTVYLGARHLIELVRRKGLSACIAGIAERIEADYRRWHDFDKTARVASHSEVGVIELMPIADATQFAFKYVNGHPSNHRHDLPTVMAFGVLADVDTGAPRLLSELTLTTAIRTAAMSALAARVLARPGSTRMALIGNGAQSEFQALAFRDLVGIRELRLFDTDAAASAKLATNLVGQGLQVRICTSTAEAVRGADIVTTVTADKASATILTPEMIEPGMHINAVGGDCPGKTELHRGVLEAAADFVEFEAQTRIEGDIQQMPADFAVTEFWRVLAGQAPGRSSADQVTVFDSVGFALEDFSALSFMRDAAAEFGIGDIVEFVPEAADPKNLFGVLREEPLPAASSPAHRRQRAAPSLAAAAAEADIGSFTPAMREADDACFRDAGLYIDTAEALAKSGDLLAPMSRGVFTRDSVRGTLADLCRGQAAGRRHAAKRTVFKSVGTALEDLAAAMLVQAHTA